MRNRLLLCAGIVRRAGWKTLDVVAGADYTAKIPPLPGVVHEVAWDEIELIHGVTSFYPWEAVELLKEIRYVLRDGGKLVLEQPDFDKAKVKVEWLFGDPGPKNPWHMNKWAYTPGILVEVLRDAGFSEIELHRAVYHVPERDFRVEAYK